MPPIDHTFFGTRSAPFIGAHACTSHPNIANATQHRQWAEIPIFGTAIYVFLPIMPPQNGGHAFRGSNALSKRIFRPLKTKP